MPEQKLGNGSNVDARRMAAYLTVQAFAAALDGSSGINSQALSGLPTFS